jgi:phage/plasmid-associated DNA primase
LPPLDTLISVSKTGRVDLRYADIARYLIQRYHPVTLKRILYIYLEDVGIYVEDTGQVENSVQEIANLVNYEGRITTAKREVVSYVMDHNVVDTYPFDQHPDALPLANGVLEIDWDAGSVQLKPYNPIYLFKQKWPVVYDPTISPDRFHANVLSRYVDDESIDALYQIPAQAILQYCGYGPFKRSYIAEGPPNGGKTTYLMSWLNALFGDENISGVSLQQIRDRFAKSDLNGAIINRYDDLSDIPLTDVGSFKALTGGFYHTIEEKHKNRFPGRITAVHVYSTNSPPTVPDQISYDPAFWVRWIYLRFNNVFETDPSFVTREFTQDAISGSFNRVLEYMFRIRDAGRLIYEQDPSEVKSTWQAATNPFEKFVADTMDSAGEPALFDKGVLFRAFLDWCGENDISPRKVPGTITGFTQLIYGSGFTTTKRGSKHHQEWQYEARKMWKPGREPEETGGLTV